jgi:hypothetical protein
MTRKWRAKVTACALTFAVSFFGLGAPAQAANDQDSAADAIKTATPIKHVIIIAPFFLKANAKNLIQRGALL